MQRYRRTASTPQKLKIRKYNRLQKYNCHAEKGLKLVPQPVTGKLWNHQKQFMRY